MLPDATSIRILSSPYFLATKLAALRSRGWQDLWLSQDLEDIVHVVDNRPVLMLEIAEAESAVRTYISQQLTALLDRPELLDVVKEVLPLGSGYGRNHEVERRLRQLISS